MKYTKEYKKISSFLDYLTTNSSKPVFYVCINGVTAGPMNEKELLSLVKKGEVCYETLVWMPNITQWTPAKCIPVVHKLLLLAYKPEKESPNSVNTESISLVQKDVIKAIASLGYKNSVAKSAAIQVFKDNPDVSLEEGIKRALILLNQ